jgi:oxygen-dependent protoporphyrinogen oxidase
LIERTPTSRKLDRVVVIGGGLSGLAAAHRMHERAGSLRRPIEVVVLEAKARIGGVIWTDRMNGFTRWGWRISLCKPTLAIAVRSWSGRVS